MSAYAAGQMAAAAGVPTFLAPCLIALFDPTPQVVAHSAKGLRLVACSERASATGVMLARSFDGAGNRVPAMAVDLISP